MATRPRCSCGMPNRLILAMRTTPLEPASQMHLWMQETQEITAQTRRGPSRSGCGLVHHALFAFPVGLAEFRLQDLAAGVAG